MGQPDYYGAAGVIKKVLTNINSKYTIISSRVINEACIPHIQGIICHFTQEQNKWQRAGCVCTQQQCLRFPARREEMHGHS